KAVGAAVVTVSDTRTLENDLGGARLVEHLERAGHQVILREIIPDEPRRIRTVLERCLVDEQIEVVLLSGGTGLSARDTTFETVSEMITRPIPGYGELFRMLSYQQVGSAAMLSRAVGGLIGKTAVLTLPGSPAAVELAMEKL